MNTMQLACFLAVAETLSFARAAEQLNVTQPAVTQQIHSLEAELNLQLFRRTTRTVELTKEGLAFLGDAKTMLEIFERAKKRTEHSLADTRDSLIIGCHSNNNIFHLVPVLRRMREQFANLYPIFRVVPFQHLYQRLSEEAVDVVVAFREDGLKEGIRYQELAKVPMVGVGAADCALAKRDKLALCDLEQSPLILLDPQKCPDQYRKPLHAVLDRCSPVNVYFCDSIEAAIALAQAGYGIAMLPDFCMNRIPSLTYLPIEGAELMSYGVYYKELAGRPLRKAFIKQVKECFSAAGCPQPQ